MRRQEARVFFLLLLFLPLSAFAVRLCLYFFCIDLLISTRSSIHLMHENALDQRCENMAVPSKSLAYPDLFLDQARSRAVTCIRDGQVSSFSMRTKLEFGMLLEIEHVVIIICQCSYDTIALGTGC